MCVQGWLVLGWPLGLPCSFCTSLKEEQCERDHLNHSGMRLLLIGLSCKSRWSAGSFVSESYISYFYDHFLYCICIFFSLVCSLCWHLFTESWSMAKVGCKTSMRSRNIYSFITFYHLSVFSPDWPWVGTFWMCKPLTIRLFPPLLQAWSGEFLTEAVFQG